MLLKNWSFMLLLLAAGPQVPAQSPAMGMALLLDGSGDEVVVPAHPTLDLGSPFTIEGWAMPAVVNYDGRGVLSRAGASAIGYFFAIQYLGALQFGTTLNFLTGPQLQPNAWYHFAWVHRFPMPDLVYVNGCLFGSFNGVPNPGASQQSLDVHIGAEPYGVTEYWNGQIDEVRIWSTARTEAQIRANIVTTLSGATPGLVSAWNFDGNANDSAGPNNGTLAGNAGFVPSTVPNVFFGGQSNSAAASLVVNGIGGFGCGPYNLDVGLSPTLTLSWSGPPNAPIILVAGPPNVANSSFGCAGKLDLGTPPSFADIIILFDGLSTLPGFLFQLNGAGLAQQSFSIGGVPPGLFIGLQGVVAPFGAGCPVVLTAAFYVSA